MTRQYVAHYPDGRYMVRTYEPDPAGTDWVLTRETPADARSVAQATLDGRVVDVEV